MYDEGSAEEQDQQAGGEPVGQDEQAPTVESLTAELAQVREDLALAQTENSAVHRENVRVAEECAKHSNKLAKVREYVEEKTFTPEVKLQTVLKILNDEWSEPQAEERADTQTA